MRADEQKPHIRLSSWASWHNTTKPTGSRGRVNATVAHRKLTFLSGETCLLCGRIIMGKIRRGFNRLTKRTRHICLLAGGHESLWETQTSQRLMISLAAPCMATYQESKQKSAEGIVVPGNRNEGLNAEKSVAIS